MDKPTGSGVPSSYLVGRSGGECPGNRGEGAKTGDEGKRKDSATTSIYHRKPGSLTPSGASIDVQSAERLAQCKERIERAFSFYGKSHPLMGKETLNDFLENVFVGIGTNKKKNVIFDQLSQSAKINYYLGALLLSRFIEKEGGDKGLNKVLSKLPEDVLERHLSTLELYYELSSEGTLEVEKIQELYLLAGETGFFPAIWRLIGLSIKPGGQCLISPLRAFSLLYNHPTNFTHKNLMQIFARSLTDLVVLQQVQLSGQLNEWQHALALISTGLTGDASSLLLFPPKGEKAFPSEIYRKICPLFMYSNELRQQEGAGKDQIESRFKPAESHALRRVEARNPGRKSRRIRDAIASKVVPELGAWESLFEQHDQRRIQGLSEYKQGVIGVVLALTYKYAEKEGGSLVKSASHLKQAAVLSNLPLLYMDAGEIFMGYGCYKEAIECFSSLRSDSRLHSLLQGELDELIELCQLKEGEREALQAALELQKEPLGQRTSRKRRKKQKASGIPAKRPSLSDEIKMQGLNLGEVADEPVSSTGSGIEISKAGPSALSTLHPEEAKKKTEKYLESPLEPSAVETESLSIAGESEALDQRQSQAQEALDTQVEADNCFLPLGGWLPDHHPEIQRFFREIRQCRDRQDLLGEKKCLDTWLKRRGQAYGRVCEEAGWFYIRQGGLPQSPVVLEGDDVQSREQLYRFAGLWLSRSLACLLQRPVQKNISVSGLKLLVEDAYKYHPEWQENPEFRKRLRSLCSSYGHVQERLAGITHGKARLTHDERSHQYYQLKRVADPFYNPAPPVQSGSKIEVVSQEEAVRRGLNKP